MVRRSLELQLKRSIGSQLPGLVTFYEPAQGSSFGAPDLSILIKVQPYLFVPVELKAQDDTKGLIGMPASKWFRGTQIAWHRQFAEVGGIALGVLGVPILDAKVFSKGKKHKAFELFVTYGFEIGSNQCMWRPISRHNIRGELLKHVAYLESDEGQRAWRGSKTG